jgi:hypothetical protein
MKIPVVTKKLYKHWSKHARISKTIDQTIKDCLNPEVLGGMSKLINERMLVWQRKNQSSDKPYTSDEILNKFRFCNVYRELDKQTMRIHLTNQKYEKDFPLWLLNVAFARFICRTETLQRIGPLSFSVDKNKAVKQKLLGLERPKYGNAYVFPVTILHKINCRNREEFFCDYLPEMIPKVAKLISFFNDESVDEILPRVTAEFGASFRFHWTEVLIDVAYQFPNLINLYKKFPIGPGAKESMIKLSPEVSPEETCLKLVSSKYSTQKLLEVGRNKILLSAENWEGVGCEYRKYVNLKNKKGRKRYYITKIE